MGSSDERQGAGSSRAPAASSPLTAEEAERFASVLKPMWELDSAPLPGPAEALGLSAGPSSQPSGNTAPYQPFAPPPPSVEPVPESDDRASTIATLPEPLSALAVQAHLPPRRQQISEPRRSVEVEFPPQTVPMMAVATRSSVPARASNGGVASASGSAGPTLDELRARAARVQTTVIIHKSDIRGFRGRRLRARASLLVAAGAVVLLVAGIGGFVLTGRHVTPATSVAVPSLPGPAPVPATATATATATGAQMAIPPPAPVESSEPIAAVSPVPFDPSAPSTPAAAMAASVSPTAKPNAARPLAGSAASTSATTNATPGTKPSAGVASPKATGKAVHKAPGTIVRASPF